MRLFSCTVITLLSSIIFFLLLSCGKEGNRSVEPVDDSDGSRRIYLSDYENFHSLRDEVYRAYCLEGAFPIRIRKSVDSKKSLPILPPDCRDDIACYKERNVLVLKRVSDYHHDSLRAHVLNDGLLEHLAVSPTQAVVFLDLKDDTSIKDFELLCDDLMKTYTSIWDDKSKAIYGLPLNNIRKERNRALKEQYPIYIKFMPAHL